METMQLEAEQLNDLEKVAKEIISLSENCPLILFHGELGSGKTTLIKNICNFLNVKEEVTSPTFSLLNQYLTKEGKLIYHFDLYRIQDLDEALDIGCDEYIDSGEICLIEWPEVIREILPDKRLEIKVEIEGSKRIFNVSKYS